MTYGLLDTVDNVWMGDSSGPAKFGDFMLARIAAQMLDVQLGQAPGRTRAVEYIEGPKRLRDTVETKLSPLAALQEIESGRLM